MGGKTSRTKGHNWEREVAKRFREHGFPLAERKLEYQISECTGVDITNTGAFKVQCKRYKDYCPISKIEEVKETGIPILITKGDRKPAVVCMYIDDFFELIKMEDEGINEQ